MAELADEDLALAIALSQHEAVPPPPIDERDAALARSLHDANREVIAVESASEPDESPASGMARARAAVACALDGLDLSVEAISTQLQEETAAGAEVFAKKAAEKAAAAPPAVAAAPARKQSLANRVPLGCASNRVGL